MKRGEEVFRGQYFRIVLAENKAKTSVFSIFSLHHGDHLGRIYWHGGWRHYVVEFDAGTIWTEDCLFEVGAFVNFLMQKRKRPNTYFLAYDKKIKRRCAHFRQGEHLISLVTGTSQKAIPERHKCENFGLDKKGVFRCVDCNKVEKKK